MRFFWMNLIRLIKPDPVMRYKLLDESNKTDNLRFCYGMNFFWMFLIRLMKSDSIELKIKCVAYRATPVN